MQRALGMFLFQLVEVQVCICILEGDLPACILQWTRGMSIVLCYPERMELHVISLRILIEGCLRAPRLYIK